MVPVLIPPPAGITNSFKARSPALGLWSWRRAGGRPGPEGLSLHCHFQALHAALNQSTASSCEAAPHQPICASPNPGLSQPPAVLALACLLVHRPRMAPAFSSHLPCVHMSVSCHPTCQAALRRPQLGPGAHALCRWVASSRPRKMLSHWPPDLTCWQHGAVPHPAKSHSPLGLCALPVQMGHALLCWLALALLLICFPQRPALARQWAPGSG